MRIPVESGLDLESGWGMCRTNEVTFMYELTRRRSVKVEGGRNDG